jgi:hypothetical protein
MKLTAHFYLLNDDFSPEYAEANHGGKETENNPLYEWEDEFEVSENLESTELIRKGSFTLAGDLPNGEAFASEVKNMFLLKLKLSNGSEGYFGVSESILENYTLEGDSDQVLKVYIRDYEPLANPMPGVFIASKEFPLELIF